MDSPAEAADILGPVVAQTDAYNRHDIDAFLACFHDDAVVAAPDGTVQMRGLKEMRLRYGVVFAAGDVTAEVVSRSHAGEWVVDRERVRRAGEVMVDALVAYHVDGNRIRRMIVLR